MHRQLLVLAVLTLSACGDNDRLEVTAAYDPLPERGLSSAGLDPLPRVPPDGGADLAERVLSPRPCDCFGDLAPFRD